MCIRDRTNAIGAAVDIGMRAELRRHHLEDKRDYQVIEAAFPNMKQLLLDHKADLVVAVPPFSYDPELRSNARTDVYKRQYHDHARIAARTLGRERHRQCVGADFRSILIGDDR